MKLLLRQYCGRFHPNKPWVQFDKDSTRRLVTWDLDLMNGLLGPRAAPGKYTAQMEINGEKQTQTFEVLKDPTTKSTSADIEEQLTFSLQLRDAMNQAVTMINELEVMRKRATEMQNLLLKTDKALSKAEKSRQMEFSAFEQSATQLSAQLYDIHLTGAREDAFRNPMQIYERLQALASDAGANSADFKPTNQQREFFAVLNERLQKVQNEYNSRIIPVWSKLNPNVQKKKTGSVGGAK